MKRGSEGKIRMIFVVLFLMVGCVFFISYRQASVVRAYTEEQKQEAKAWLSAHGYPATKEGAYQAYQDYLSGKLSLSEEDQKRVSQSLGKSSEKKKKSSNKKRNKETSRKKKKSDKNEVTSDKKKKTSIEPHEADKDNKQEQIQPSKTALPSSLPSTSPTHTINEERKDGVVNDKNKAGNSKFFWAGGGFLLIVVFGALILLLWKKRNRSQSG